MKKIAAIACMIGIIFITSVSGVSAAGFKIEETSPSDGATGVPVDNMGVKITFSQDVYSKKYNDINEKAVKILDDKGKEVPIKVAMSPKHKTQALVLVELEDSKGKAVKIDPKAKYKFIIDDNFTAADGTKLGKTTEIAFTTLNPADSMKISMGMMAVMVVGMIFATTRAAKKSREEQEQGTKKEEKFNPYKIAKETGRPVKEIIEEYNKKKAKEEAKNAKKAKVKEEIEEFEEELLPGHYKVKTMRTVAEGGSSYITGRKAEAEKKAELEAKRKAQAAKNKSNKGKKKKK